MSIPVTDQSRNYAVTVAYGDVAGITIFTLQQRIALIAQGATAATFTEGKTANIASAAQVGALAGLGSPAHLMTLELLPEDGRPRVAGVPIDLFLLDDADGAAASVNRIAITGTTQTTDQVYRIRIGGIYTKQFIVPATSTPAQAAPLFTAAINAILNMPVVASTDTVNCNMTFKSKGTIGNNLDITIEGTVDGLTFTISEVTPGSVNPDIDDAFALTANTWYTMAVVGCTTYADTATLLQIYNWGEGRWTIKKPCIVFFGTSDDVTTRTAITDAAAQKLNRSAALIPAPGSPNMWHVIAARAVAYIATTANATPAQNYNSNLVGITAGADTDQDVRNASSDEMEISFDLGSGTTILSDGQVQLNDVITMYHPTTDAVGAYKYVVDIVKLQNIIYGLDQYFDAPSIKGLPLLADTAEGTFAYAFKRPRDIKADLQRIADQQLNFLLLADAEYTKSNLTVTINSQNSKRIDPFYPVKTSGNIEVIDATVQFAFYFGG